MSEYQQYEWLAVDRPLTDEEQVEVDGLSSHIDVSATGAVVTYNWGDFKHDPVKVLARYFDAFMYFANWGSQWLAFRFPKGLLNDSQVAPYLWDDEVTLAAAGEYWILTIAPQDEGDGEEVDYEASLATLSRLRDDILRGDYRALYLAWLHTAGQWDIEDEIEPPVPAGLQHLSGPLAAFVRFFDMDSDLIDAAAQASPEPAARQEAAPEEMLERLPPAERDDFLLRLARGEPHLSLALNRRLRELAGRPEPDTSSAPRRTLSQLQAVVERLREEAERREREAAEARRRKEQEAAETRLRQMLDALSKREPAAWHDVEALIQKKTASAYDQATALLTNLRDLAGREGRLPAFQARLAELRDKYANRPALLERLRKLE